MYESTACALLRYFPRDQIRASRQRFSVDMASILLVTGSFGESLLFPSNAGISSIPFFCSLSVGILEASLRNRLMRDSL